MNNSTEKGTRNPTPRLKAGSLLFVVAIGLVSTMFLGAPKPAHAQWVTFDSGLNPFFVGQYAQKSVSQVLVESAVLAVVNGANYFTSQLAYTAAVALTSDCPGQIACWDSKAFKDGFTQAWQGAIGEAIGSLSQDVLGNKLLCNPGALFKMVIQLGMLAELKPPPPKCDFNALVSSWDNVIDSFSSGEVLNQLKPTFQPGQTPIGVGINVLDGLYQAKANAQTNSIMQHLMDASAGGGFSAIRNPVSGRVKSPNEVTREEFRRSRAGENQQLDQSSKANAGSIAASAVVSVVLNATQTFVQTLVARLWNKLVSGLLSESDLIAFQPDIILNPEAVLSPPGATGQEVNLQTKFVGATSRDGGQFDPLIDFTSCGAASGPQNCVMDAQFANAVRLGDATPITVGDAIKKKMLHGDWPLYPATSREKDQDRYCYTYGYCESNLKKLRAYRIIPIGWEIAASESDPTTPVSLGEVVSRFNDCDPATGAISGEHPYCHLIDPDWVLKVPPTQCRAEVNGPSLVSPDASTRTEVCADAVSCLRQDDLGVCTGGWGYCQRERNVWRFNGDQCPAYYNTCRTLQTRNSGPESFLMNTLDVGVCNADNVGCLAYSVQSNVANYQTKRFCQAGDNVGHVCTSNGDCPGTGGVCGDLAKSYCRGGSDAGKVCTSSTDCNSKDCGFGCPLNAGCLAGEASGLNGCTVSVGDQTCSADDGAICQLDNKCGVGGGCPCYLATCRVPKGLNSCTSVTGDDQTNADDWRNQPQRYFNKNVKTCASTDAGCSALVPLQQGQSLNLVQNGGFEQLEDGDGDGTPDHPAHWAPFGEVPDSALGGVLTNDPAKAVDGTYAMKVMPYNTETSSTLRNADMCDLGSECANDAGCTCKDSTYTGYTCLVSKGQQKCYVTDQVVQDGLPVKPDANYTLSATFVKGTGANVGGRMIMHFTDPFGKLSSVTSGSIVSTTVFTNKNGQAVKFGTADCTTDNGRLVFRFNNPYSCSGGTKAGQACVQNSDCDSGLCATGGTLVDTQVRASCMFAINGVNIRHASLEIGGFDGSSNAYVDEVQLEQGPLTPFHEGYGSATSVTDAKMPPAYLGCTGEDTDPPECANYATVCREQEVGCDRYTPTDGDPAVPAVTGPQDSCPAECAGYDVFKQGATDFDQEKFPVYFIPSTATQCTADQSGCSEFTNVETEKVEYFSQLRLCQKPSSDPKTVFYSWEGSDTSGYQLKVWNLKKITNDSGGDAVSINNGWCCQNGVCSTCDSTKIAAGQSGDVCANPGTCPNAGVAPCTKLDSSAINCASGDSAVTGKCVGGPDDGAACNVDDECTSKHCSADEGVCSRADIDNGNLDCREFYDADGNRHYRLLSKTIVLTDDCHQYRITTSTATDCGNSNGQWLPDKGQCIYNADVGASLSCSAEVNGCHPYMGNAAGNVRTLFIDTFEDGLGDYVNGGVNVKQSGESVVVGGHSMKFIDASSVDKEVGGEVAPGRSYTLSFWARGQGTLSVSFANGQNPFTCDYGQVCSATNGCQCVSPTGLTCTVANTQQTCTIAQIAVTQPTFGTLTLTPDWKQYNYGPLNVSDKNWGTTSTYFHIAKTGSGEGFIDNVTLKEAPDNIYVVRDSWNTPASCDQTSQGVPSPQEMLGCKEYTNAETSKVYLRSFAQLCRDKAVGCQAFSYTQNNLTTPYEESYNAVCQLQDKRGTPLERFCGKCTLPPGQKGPATCNDGINTCVVAAGATDCAVGADEGSNCKCDYDNRHVWYTDTVTGDLPDVCRVSIGESECHFKLDRWDDNTDPATHPDRVNVGADDRTYLVMQPQFQCAASAVGCKEVGDPHITYEQQCNLTDAYGNVVACGSGAPGWDSGTSTCKCGPKNNATCTMEKGSKTCILSLENGINGDWQTKSLVDDPAQYGQTLCTQPAIGCEEFTATDGKFYFKEPFDRTCTYKEGIQIDGQNRYGWFRKSPNGKDIPCYPELLQNGEDYNIYKNADPVCHLDVGTCDPVAHPDGCLCTIPPSTTPVCKVAPGNTTCGYQGWVGQCTPEFDRCEEFVDPLATSPANPKGQPYYYLMNQKLDLTSCAGSGSLKAGCVLFARTSDTSRTYSAAATYLKSDQANNGGRVATENCNQNPRSPYCDHRCLGIDNGVCSVSKKACRNNSDCGGGDTCVGDIYYGSGCTSNNDCNQAKGELCTKGAYNPSDRCNGGVCTVSGGTCTKDLDCSHFTDNDANIIVSVRRDRECAQWLSCDTVESLWDSTSGQWKNVCVGLDACSQQRQVGESQDCGEWVDQPKTILTSTEYTSRDTTFKGIEYSGYSLVNKYPAQFLTLAQSGDAPSSRLYGVEVYEGTGLCSTSKTKCVVNADCGGGEKCLPVSCKSDSDCPKDSVGTGKCYASRCIYDLRGGPVRNVYDNQGQCRGFAEADSPFPTSVAADAGSFTSDSFGDQVDSKKSAFAGANVCTKDNDCACSYQRIDFGAGRATERYYALGSPLHIPKGVCSGGINDGESCSTKADCNGGSTDPKDDQGGVCDLKTVQTGVIGWEGFCIDPDYSFTINGDQGQFACNLWLPVDQLAGAPDLNNQATSAGYVNNKQLLYCKVAEGTKSDAFGGTNYKQVLYDDTSLLGTDASDDGGPTSLWEAHPHGTYFQKEVDPDGTTTGSSGIAWMGYKGFCNPSPDLTFCNNDSDCNGKNACNAGSCYDAQSNKIACPVSGCKPSVCNGFSGNFTPYWNGQVNGKNPTITLEQVAGLHLYMSGSCESDSGYKRTDADVYLKPNADFSRWTWTREWNSNGDSNQADGLGVSGAVGWDTNNSDSFCLGMLDGNDNCGDHPNCLAIGVDFDLTTGKVKDIKAASCYHQSWPADCDPRYVAKIVAEKREVCSQVQLVNDPQNRTTLPSVPWTNVLHNGTKSGQGWDFKHISKRFDGTASVPVASDLTPYGVIGNKYNPSGSDITFDPNGGSANIFNWTIPVFDSEGGSTTPFVDWDGTNKKYILNAGSTESGIAFSCMGDCGGGFAIPSGWKKLGANAWQTAEANLSQIFVMGWQTYRWDPPGSWVPSAAANAVYKKVGDMYDKREVYAIDTMAPRVRAVNVGNCTGTAGNTQDCQEGDSPGLSVGKTMKGDVLGVGKYRAQINFYAWADKDHMPIRKVVVDYGDGSTESNSGTPSYFANHRGCVLDSSGNCIPAKSQCDGSEWGKTTESCVNSYFTYYKTYRCSKAYLSTLPSCSASQGYPCQRDYNCVYKPRVRVVDNWGQCNGICPSPPGKGNVCIQPTDPAKGIDFDGSGECDTIYNPTDLSTWQAWTEYQGEIIVSPPAS